MKKIISFIILFVFLTGINGFNALAAANVISSGKCGSNVRYELDDEGLLRIYGSGEMENYSYNNTPWKDNKGKIKEVKIEDGVTNVGPWSFSYCSAISSVEISNTVKSIGDDAFSSCEKLTSINIPNSVTSIGASAFTVCSSLANVEMPNSVLSIGKNAFDRCISLKSINISNSVTIIETETFKDCGLTSITIPNSVTSIGDKAFKGCGYITSITIPNSVTSIGEAAFESCFGLSSIDIPNSVTSIGASALGNCPELASVKLSNSLKSIERGLFAYCGSLTSVTIPNSVLSIGEHAFNDCISLTSVDIPNSVTSIGEYAFVFCTSLPSIVIPESVTSIGRNAFQGCHSLEEVTCKAQNVPSFDINLFSSCNKISTGTLYVPKESLEAYKAASSWKDWGQILPIQNTSNIIASGMCGENVNWELDDEGFLRIFGCGSIYAWYSTWGWDKYIESIKEIKIEDGITIIGDWAFWNCRSAVSISIPNTVEIIGKYAFEGCSSLISISVDISNPNYCAEENVLFNKEKTDLICYPGGKTGEYSIPNSVTSIGNGAFEDCMSLTSVTIPNSVTSIGEYAFSDCSGLTSVTIPNSVTSIENRAFSGCRGLTSVTIPNSVTIIGTNAFSYCFSLTTITSEAAIVPTLGGEVFYSAPTASGTLYVPKESLEAYKAVEGWKDWGQILPIQNTSNIIASGMCGDNVEWELDDKGLLRIWGRGDMWDYEWKGAPWYSYCFNIETINIESGVTSIGDYALYFCPDLTSLVIPNTVTSIGDYAICDCRSLTSITIPNSVTSIGNGAFSGCKALTSITIPNSVLSVGNNVFRLCSGLTSVTIPNSVTSIGDCAFEDCMSLASVTIPNSVTTIGFGAFSGCSSLTSVAIPYSVTSIGTSAFSNCSSLTSIIVDSFNPNYCAENNVLFTKDKTTLGCCAGGKTGDYSIPNSVTSIWDCAFEGCSALTSVTIPNSVTIIGTNAFSGCSSLTTITSEATIVPTLGGEVFNSASTAFGTLYVPRESLEAYKAAEGWKEWGQILPITNDETAVIIADGMEYDNIKENIEGLDVLYQRTFNTSNTWEALSVPMKFNVADNAAAFDIAEIYALSPCRDTNGDRKVDEKDEMALIVKVKNTGDIIPNTPYVIRAKSAGDVLITSSDNKIYKEKTRPIAISLVSDVYSFAGVRSSIYINKENEYVVNGSQLESGTNYNATVVPNRWTMTIDSKNSGSHARQMRIYTLGEDVIETMANGKRRFVLIDEATDIDYLYQVGKNSDIYTIDGRKVDDSTSLPAGIYIKNGKKIIIR